MNTPADNRAASHTGQPAGRAAAFDDLLLEPDDDDYLDRCLFEFRETPADYRNV